MVTTAAVLCPGQGSQRVGMGKDVGERFPAARDVFTQIDDALGVALTRLMWDGPEADLTLTHNAQPAILAHTLAVHAVVRDAIRPLAAAGHSLGEYSAYVTAGSLTVIDAARLVRRRGELMLDAGTRRAGTMAAVLGLDADVVVTACRDASANGEVAVAANLNAPDQTVISGDPAAVERAGVACKSAGAKRVMALKVSGAFHSPLMAPAASVFERDLAAASIQAPAFPVVANATAEPVREAAAARRGLTEQLTAPVRWVESMRRCATEVAPGTLFLELGPGTVLAGLMKRIVPDVTTRSVGTAEEIAKFLEGAA